MEALLTNDSDKPPTSAILLDSCHFSQVVFTNVEKFYVPGADIICHYNVSEYVVPRKKDWVGIFRVGWKTTNEYYTFMWAPLLNSPNSKDAEHRELLFKAYYLPKDDEYYQFCYVDQDGLVRGASIPFQFRAEVEDDMLVVTTQGEVEEIEQQNTALLQENQKLKENLRSLQRQNEDLQKKLKVTEEKTKEFEDKVCLLQTGTLELQRAQDLQDLEISSAQTELAATTEMNRKLQKENQDLHKSLETLRSSSEELSLEVDLLKNEITQLEIKSDAMEAELHQVKAENKNVLSAKDHLENRLKATLVCMDQLQSQVQSQQKEVESLQEANQDKGRLMEQLKEENRQLNVTFFRQQTYADVDVELDEKTFLLQTLQKKKDKVEKENQRLRQENAELMAHLPTDVLDIPSGVLPHSKENAGLLYGNPYSVLDDLSELCLEPVKQCPVCGEVLPNDIGEKQYCKHVRSHLLECPYCVETFDKSNEQVYEDHVYCHGLD